MGLLDHLSNLRFSGAVDWYVQNGSKLGTFGRSGAVPTAAATAARAGAHAEGLPNAPGQPPAEPHGVLATLGRGMQAAIGFEKALTAPLGKIPFPGFPALRVLDVDIGLPHAHNHPPNLTPPNPVPIPLPSAGPIIPIPIVSGAANTKIDGRAAARCGDMGLGIWCGGFFPVYEVFLGSATVWIESARAGRLLVDITKHCTFSSPKPSDPPMGPMIGTTVAAGSGTVMIGGIPMPSLFAMAMAQAFKYAFKGLGLVFRRLTAKSYIQKLLASGRLQIHAPAGAGNYANDVMRDLERIAETKSGRDMLNRLEKTGQSVTIQPYNGGGLNAWAQAKSMDGIMDIATGLKMPGCDSTVAHSPEIWANHSSQAGAVHPNPGTTSDAILFHEMNHATNNAQGMGRMEGTTSAQNWDNRWNNYEEYQTVAAENGYRRDTGLPQRTAYTNGLP